MIWNMFFWETWFSSFSIFDPLIPVRCLSRTLKLHFQRFTKGSLQQYFLKQWQWQCHEIFYPFLVKKKHYLGPLWTGKNGFFAFVRGLQNNFEGLSLTLRNNQPKQSICVCLVFALQYISLSNSNIFKIWRFDMGLPQRIFMDIEFTGEPFVFY